MVEYRQIHYGRVCAPRKRSLMVDKILGADFSKIAGVYEKVYNGFFSGKV